MSSALEYLPPIEVKRTGGAGELEGYGSTFGNVDLAGDIVAPGAFAKTLAEHRAASTMPALLWSHDISAPCGTWTDAKEDRVGLRMKGRLSLDTVRGAEARALGRDGALGLSIGFVTRDAAYEKGRRVLKDLQLFEVSLVAIPANPQAKLTSVKSAVDGGELTARAIEAMLIAGGCPHRLAKKIVSGGWSAAARCDDEADPKAVEALVAAVKANTERLSQLSGGCARSRTQYSFPGPGKHRLPGRSRKWNS